MSLLYQRGGKLPEDISTVLDRHILDDTDQFFYKDSDNSAPVEDYEMFKYVDKYTEPSDPSAKSVDNPIVYKVGSNTLGNDIPYANVLRSELPFENEFEWMRYRDFLHEKELSGRSDKASLKHFNSGGYVGAYQLGVLALQEANMLKPGDKLIGKGQKSKIMTASNWIGGQESRDAFLSNIRIQEDALKRYTAKNFRYIKKTLLNNNILHKDDIMGLLASTHLAGQKNVRAYINKTTLNNKVKASRTGSRDNGDGTDSSHLMAWGDDGKGNYIAFPTLFQRENGEWYKGGLNEARKRGEVYNMRNKKEAISFAGGDWKDENSIFKDGNGTTIDVYKDGYAKWIKDQYIDGQGKRRYFDKKNAVEMLKKKGIIVNTEDYFPEDYRIPGSKTLPWQE